MCFNGGEYILSIFSSQLPFPTELHTLYKEPREFPSLLFKFHTTRIKTTGLFTGGVGRGFPVVMDSHVPTHQTGSWTNEKHVRFLNTMEATFVRSMFESNDRNVLRLDRHLPDSSESTLDSKAQRRDKHATSGGGSRKDSTRADKRPRARVSSRPCNPSKDQVVPQLESKTDGDQDGT
ncbi:uncharacterized protein LOC121251444 isoform X2 [Juglans microcarpa x Juglans regia]|uniref:uncharacterized protein LOC121251444 isoform X2 n=1 Tax=Juglans microcarpa x Juglans regia TaxID=2249226 RepID=UPI001B7DE652|nr:uncharacterized protein LOC121251444 isoform X2 [Juglans microcarpa x Juglans regia]